MTRASIIGLLVAGLTLGMITLLGPSSGHSAEPKMNARLVLPMTARDQANKPTVTPTHTPTNTPAPTPTPAPSGVYLRDNSSSYTSIIGSLWIVGEVVNGTGHPVSFVEIDAAFYSANGTLLDTDFTFSDVWTIPAGGDSPFSLLAFSPPPGIVSYVLTVSDWDDDPYRPPTSGLQGTITNSFVSIIDTLHDVGTVTNDSATTYEFVAVIIAYYDAAGTVIAVDFTFTSPTTLAPGQTGTFEVLVFDGGNLPIATRKMWIDGSPQ